MTPEEHTRAAEALFQAEASGKQIGLLSLAHPGMTLDDAYAVQSALVARKLAAGRRVIGWKIGLTSRAMQDALKIDTPDSGVLFDDMLFADGAVVPAGRFIQPRIEAEIAFIMKAPLAGAETRADVIAATEAVAPSVEVEQELFNVIGYAIRRADEGLGAAHPLLTKGMRGIVRLMLNRRRRDRLDQRLNQNTRSAKNFQRYNTYLMLKLAPKS